MAQIVKRAIPPPPEMCGTELLPALGEKHGILQVVNVRLAFSARARIFMTELAGSSLPEGCALQIHGILEISVIFLSWEQCLDLEQQAGHPYLVQETFESVFSVR